MAGGRARRWLAALLPAALALTGCSQTVDPRRASAEARHRAAASSAPPPSGRIIIPAPPPTGAPADPAALAVIRAWSTTLGNGDVRAAARYFALPSELINGGGGGGRGGGGGVAAVIEIRTLAQAEAANETLPCGAEFISADQRGRYVNALFRLTERPGAGSGCGSGIGLTARTNFLIAHGRIVQWIRAPDDPGDNGGPPAPTSPQPSTPPVAPRA